jgi:hypothetical protein
VQQRVGRAVVAVERDAHGPGRDKLDAPRPGPLEGQMEVAEDDPPVAGSGQQLVLVVAGLGPEGLEVVLGRRVPGRRALAQRRARRQLAQPVDGLRVDQVAHRLHAAAGRLVVGCPGRRPAVDVPADPGRRVELAQAGHRLGRPAPEDRVVAPQQPAVRALGASVVEDGVERR